MGLNHFRYYYCKIIILADRDIVPSTARIAASYLQLQKDVICRRIREGTKLNSLQVSDRLGTTARSRIPPIRHMLMIER